MTDIIPFTQCIVPSDAVSFHQPINKVKTAITAETISSIASIPIISYEKMENMNTKIIIQNFSNFRQILYNTACLSPDELFYMCAQWHSVPKFPGWNGFMEAITDSQKYQKAHIIFFPFVNLPPSSLDCINSVLVLAAAECKKLGLKTRFVTFDQLFNLKTNEMFNIKHINIIQ